MRLFCDAVNLYFSENPDTLGSSELKELRKQADKFHMLDSFPIDSLPGGIKEDILDAHTKTDYGRTKAEFIYRRIIEYAIEKNWSVKEHTLTPGEAAVLQLEHPEYLFSKNLSELSHPGHDPSAHGQTQESGGKIPSGFQALAGKSEDTQT